MEIVIDFSAIPTSNPIIFAWWFFKTIGWIYPVFLFVYGLILVWQNYIRNQDRKRKKYILLAIDIPKNNEQSPRAVENMFGHLAGAHQPLKFYQKWWAGEVPDSFSFEIVSIGGYIQFIMHLRDIYRDLIEAIIYAQYPDAEITEVEDYTKHWNVKFPRDADKYDLMGTEIKLKASDIYPVITYKEFEDTLSQELKDPMASLLEALTRIGPGEEIWLQFVVTPADNDWGDKAKYTINKLIGAKGKIKKNIPDWIEGAGKIALASLNTEPAPDSNKRKDESNQWMSLTQGQKDEVSAIEHKVSKLGFHTRIRWIYIAEKSAFVRKRGSSGIYGAFKQFNNLGLNSFKPDKLTYTGAIVWFKKIRLIWRKNKILYRYKNRGHLLPPGAYGFVLNTEELASLWHFPVMTVKAPLVKKSEAKKAEPPMGLPIENIKPVQLKKKSEVKKEGPPADLPT